LFTSWFFLESTISPKSPLVRLRCHVTHASSASAGE
jgi:hypothetical protein